MGSSFSSVFFGQHPQAVRRLASGLLAASVVAAGAAAFHAQTQPPVLVILDQTAIQYGPPPLVMLPEAVNAPIKAVGLRDVLPYFAARTDESTTLPSGQEGNDGWFAIRSVPASWASEPGADDGLQNYWLAGSGLGSPDESGDRTSLLGSVTGIAPLRAAGLGTLVGRQVCAVVHDGDVAVSGTPSAAALTGTNLGVVAFEVTGVDTASGDWPAVTIKILNVKATCGDAFVVAPDLPQ